MLLFALLVLVPLTAIAATAAILAHRSNKCAQAAAASAIAAAAPRPHHSRLDVQAPGPELFHCRHCHALIEATPDGWSVPYVDVATRSGACAGQAGPFVTWHEPAIADRWLADVEPGDLTPAESTGILAPLPEPVEDGRMRCIHDRRPIEPAVPISGDVGHPWRHVDGGPACWWNGTQYLAGLVGKYAEPDRPAIGSRPPLSLIPAPDVAAGGEL